MYCPVRRRYKFRCPLRCSVSRPSATLLWRKWRYVPCRRGSFVPRNGNWGHWQLLHRLHSVRHFFWKPCCRICRLYSAYWQLQSVFLAECLVRSRERWHEDSPRQWFRFSYRPAFWTRQYCCQLLLSGGHRFRLRHVHRRPAYRYTYRGVCAHVPCRSGGGCCRQCTLLHCCCLQVSIRSLP